VCSSRSSTSAGACPVNASETVVVGRVGKSHGLDGSFVVEIASEAPERFEVGAELIVEGVPA
jgi:ribosomal 30S subunit maturation factor RimM